MSDDQDTKSDDIERLDALVQFCERSAVTAGYGEQLLTVQREEAAFSTTARVLWWSALCGLISLKPGSSDYTFARTSFDVFASGIALGDSELSIVTKYLEALETAKANKSKGHRQKFWERNPEIFEAACNHYDRLVDEGQKPSAGTFWQSRVVRDGELKRFCSSLHERDPLEESKVTLDVVRRLWTEVRKIKCPK